MLCILTLNAFVVPFYKYLHLLITWGVTFIRFIIRLYYLFNFGVEDFSAIRSFFSVLLFFLVLFLQSIFMLGRSVSSCTCSSNNLKRLATSKVLGFCDSLMAVTLGCHSLLKHLKTLLTTSLFSKVLPSPTSLFTMRGYLSCWSTSLVA